MMEEEEIRLCHTDRPSQRRKIYADESSDRPEDRHYL